VIAAEKTCNHIKDIFDLNYTLKTNDNLQLQLGLALAQQIITFFEGRISFQNQKDRSTSLKISFPKFALRNTIADLNDNPKSATVQKDIAHHF
ncbi:hypothetical protein DRO91_07585, partial [Candidatus Heimdallarchaeota archaeon]